MSLREEMWKYEQITGESAEHVPIIKLGAFLDGYEMALKALEQGLGKGHWISHREHCENLGLIPSGLGAYEWCSNCDCGIDVKEFHRNHYNFCPNCGADMRGSDSE